VTSSTDVPLPLGDLPRALDRAGSRHVLLVTGPSARFVDRVTPLLGQRPVTVFAKARRHVPSDVIAEAEKVLAESGADTVIALGGGSAIGLGKALRLSHDVTLIAIPTTYSGSEHTNIHGRVVDGKKVTARDDRVRPAVVIHDVELTLDMPKTLSVTSLLNALAHPLGALLTKESETERERALRAVELVYGAIEALLRAPGERRGREQAQRGAALAALVLESAKLGVHHKLAHTLGGALDLEHGALHSVLLPHTVHAARATVPEALEAVEARLGVTDLEATLFDFLVRAGAHVSLKGLGVERARFDALLASSPELPAPLLGSAYHGRRPSRRVRHEDLGLKEPVAATGPALDAASRIVVAIHGRGVTAESALGRVLELAGHAPDLTVLSPQARDNVWYAGRYGENKKNLVELESALAMTGAVLDRAVSAVGASNVVLYGFSQGGCLALELFLRRGERLGALIALSGAAIGSEAEQITPAPGLAGTPVLLGASRGDPWLKREDVERTAARLQAAGLDVRLVMSAGETHALHAEHRLAARPLVTGAPEPRAPQGFGNEQHAEALAGSIPDEQNVPRRGPYGLFPEQINGTGFTARRAENLRTWLYRIRPAVQQSAFAPLDHPTFTHDFEAEPPEPSLIGFSPLELPQAPADFVDGMKTLGGAGSATLRRGYAVHLYAANRSMEDRAFTSTDGDLLIVPELGALTLLTELGALSVSAGELALVPRGIRFSVVLREGSARGTVAEVFGRHFALPERGLVGANGLAEARHFRAPVPFYEDRLAPGYRITAKYGGVLHEARQDYSPFDVAGWRGTYAPYAYDLALFSPVGNTRIDHADPSIHTVLSAPLDEPGTATLDLVAFTPRWDPTEGTFRPPYFHRNGTTEINGIIRETVTRGTFFVPGALFVTPGMTPHGPGASLLRRTLDQPDDVADRPHRYSDHALWFQFETTLPFSLTRWAKTAPERVRDFTSVWGTYRTRFGG
jgi:homogentisate 1,2-dioxygenase